MPNINKKNLSALYLSTDIGQIWQSSQMLPVIDHPVFGKISPHQYRTQYHQKPCPFCGQKMVHGKSQHSTNSKQEAISRGYEYQDAQGIKVINRIGNTYFHPHYVTLDHKLNKARMPEQMFDYDNLQIMCWKCNSTKGDNNAYELQHSLSYIQDLVQETLKRYPMID